MENNSAQNDALVGKFFHSKKNGEISWQGRIEAVVHTSQTDKFYLVLLYEWFAGLPSTQEIVRLSDMLGWNIYDTNDEMNSYAEAHGKGRSPFAKSFKMDD